MPVIIILLMCLWFGVDSVQAQPGFAPDTEKLSASERWILKKVGAGELADLKQHFGEEKRLRQMRAEFLVKLLTGGFPQLKIPYQGVRINQAIISGPLDLENAEIDHWLELQDCQFQDEINLRDCWFRKGLTMSRCLFTRKAEMQRLRVGLSANFSESVFQGPLDLWRAQISGILQANGLKCEDRETGTNFNSMTVGQAAYFNQAVFQGPVNLVGCKMGEVAQIMGSFFGGPLNCFGAQIGSQLAIVQTQFAGGADFGYVSIGSQFIADGAQFQHPQALANFNSLRVVHSASFKKAAFSGPVSFVTATVGSELQLDGAIFASDSQEANFNGMKVSQFASFRGTVFRGPTIFTGANIGGELAFLQSQFLLAAQPVSMKEMQVGATAYFWDSTWAGGLDLSGARLHKVVFGFPAGREGELASLKLENAIIDRTLSLENLQIGQMAARKLMVKDGVELTGAKILDGADLRDSTFSSLNFYTTEWPQKVDTLWLEGLTYQSLGTGAGQENWPALLAWVEQGRYDTRNYGQLETFFKQGGYKDRADEVYVKGQRREVMQQWWRPGNLATLIFWDLLAGYGRKPARAFWVSLSIVLAGTLVFGEKNFDPTFIGSWNWLREGGRSRVWVFRFFVSLDQFLPGIDLGLAKLWNLSEISYWELVYYHFHKLAGWILIPIGLAALYSQFR